MLCPEVSNFSPPSINFSLKQNENIEKVTNLIQMNNFYKSVIVTCPDELNMDFIRDILINDNEYYRISNCPLTEFVERDFIEYFIRNGKVTCISTHKNCMVENCIALTPDGILTLHVLDFIYQTLGIEGTKKPYNYHEIIIDLKRLNNFEKVRNALIKLGSSDFHLTWEPNDEKVCPSSIAKYLCNRNINVSVHHITTQNVIPQIIKVPTLIGSEIDEVVEWIGMLAHNADIAPIESYISTYNEPECEKWIDSTRISILIGKGFLTPAILTKVCQSVAEYVNSRELENYWAAVSAQGHEESLWQSSASSPRMFQSHNTSTNVFYTTDGCTVYSVGQLKYS